MSRSAGEKGRSVPIFGGGTVSKSDPSTRGPEAPGNQIAQLQETLRLIEEQRDQMARRRRLHLLIVGGGVQSLEALYGVLRERLGS